MTQKSCICICCPIGCVVSVDVDDSAEQPVVEHVEGFKCRRGKDYAIQEAIDPVRMITATVRVRDRLLPASVKTTEPVSKSIMKDVLTCIHACVLDAPVYEGDIAISQVAGTDVDVIVTKTVL